MNGGRNKMCPTNGWGKHCNARNTTVLDLIKGD